MKAWLPCLSLVVSGPILCAAHDSGSVAPLSVTQTAEVNLPNDAPDHGSVQVVVHIDETGQLLDALVVGYTHPDLIEPTLTALKASQFERPYADGACPTALRTTITCRFDAQGRVVTIRPNHTTTERFFNVPPQLQSQLCRPSELDRPLEIVAKGAEPEGVEGQPSHVVVDFYVDESGHPRMPVVTQGAENLVPASTALRAIDSWRFAPPTRHGRPVIVRVSQEFVFAG